MSYRLKIARAEQKLIAIRNDETKTAARYDEIITLRMKLLDILDELERDQIIEGNKWIPRIEEMAKKWGKKGDCV
jgi:hypothetical protein